MSTYQVALDVHHHLQCSCHLASTETVKTNILNSQIPVQVFLAFNKSQEVLTGCPNQTRQF